MEYNSKILENKTLNLRLNYYILTNQYRLFQSFIFKSKGDHNANKREVSFSGFLEIWISIGI